MMTIFLKEKLKDAQIFNTPHLKCYLYGRSAKNLLIHGESEKTYSFVKVLTKESAKVHCLY